MTRFLTFVFALCLFLVSVSDSQAQLRGRFRGCANGSCGAVEVVKSVAAKPKATEPAVEEGRRKGRLRDIIKRILRR